MARLDVTSQRERTSSTSTNPRPTAVADRASAIHELFELLFRDIPGSPNVAFTSGVAIYRGTSARATIMLAHPGVVRDLLLGGSDVGAAEAFIRGAVSVDGDLESAIDALAVARRVRTAREWLAIARLASRVSPAPRQPRGAPAAGSPQQRQAAQLQGRRHSRERDRAAVEYHYNVSNEFYALWLDANMTYSCAYFRTPADSLDLAQQQKYDHIARKLRLKAGECVLDIGCGWGGMIRFFAREYGARAVGVTLSSRQAEYARQRIAREGLSELVRVELLDYRDLSSLGQFEKVASVGMVEHVGSNNLAAYFDAAHRALVPGGLFLNHGIISQTPVPAGWRGVIARFTRPRSDFIERYVFPESDLLRLDNATAAAERAGFEMLDTENLRPHYQRTLQHWVRGLEANEAEARRIVGDETYNTWRLYMAGSAQGFGSGRLGVVQMLLAKREADGSHCAPHTRDDIYARA
jgi:cyclopropane-fatty-acyl-phospholipid synthase